MRFKIIPEQQQPSVIAETFPATVTAAIQDFVRFPWQNPNGFFFSLHTNFPRLFKPKSSIENWEIWIAP